MSLLNFYKLKNLQVSLTGLAKRLEFLEESHLIIIWEELKWQKWSHFISLILISWSVKKLYFSSLREILSVFKIYARTSQQQTKRALDEAGRTNLMRRIFNDIKIRFFHLRRTPWSCEFCELWIAPVILSKEQKEITSDKIQGYEKLAFKTTSFCPEHKLIIYFLPKPNMDLAFLRHDLHCPTYRGNPDFGSGENFACEI